MQTEDESLEVVLEGGGRDGTMWSALVHPDLSVEGGLYTFVERARLGGRRARSGMGGPKLYGDNVVNIWAGRSDGAPPFILLRELPSIEESGLISILRLQSATRPRYPAGTVSSGF